MNEREKKKSFTKIITNEYFYSVFAKTLGVALGLLYSVLFSRYLGASLRGEASIVSNYAALSSIVLCFGIYQAYPFFRKSNILSTRVLYLDYINLCLGICILYMLFSILTVALLPISLERKIPFIIIPFMTGTRLLNYVVMVEHPKVRNTASILLLIIDIIMVGCLILFTKANVFYCFGLLIVKEVIYFFVSVLNLHISPVEIRPTLRGLWPYLKYGFIPMLTVVFMEINYKVDVLMLEGKVRNDAIGVYSLGVQLAEKLWLIPDALKDILLSKLAKGKEADEVAKVIRISLLVMMFFMGAAIVFGRPFVDILFGPEYRNAYEIMLIIISSVLAMVFYKMIFAYNVVHGHRIINMVLLGSAAVANIIINAILIPIMGTFGAAVASLISYSFCGMAFLLYFIHNTGIKLHEVLFIKKSDIKSVVGIIGWWNGEKSDENA